jgi:chromosome segregation ATPase
MSIDPRTKFFPTAPSQDDYDAAVKRAESAEDHLRREVASSQALQAEARSQREHKATIIRALADAEGELADARAENSATKSAVTLRDTVIAELTGKLDDTITSNGNLLAALVARDATIAAMSGQMETLREHVAELAAQVEAHASADEAISNNA